MCSRWLASTLFAAAVLPVYADTGFLNRTVTVAGAAYRYVVYVPPEWTAERSWPVILFLHGSEETGSDGQRQSYVGLGRSIRNHPGRFPAIVVMPQCQPGFSWQSPEMQAQSLAALDAATEEFHGDPRRASLTGFSMGGYGAWALAAQNPERFATLVIVCGGIIWPPNAARRRIKPGPENPYTRTAQAVSRLPIWLFHGDRYPNVPVTESRRMLAALLSLNANVQYTEYKGMAHRIWDEAYDGPQVPLWLLGQAKR